MDQMEMLLLLMDLLDLMDLQVVVVPLDLQVEVVHQVVADLLDLTDLLVLQDLQVSRHGHNINGKELLVHHSK